MIWCLLNRASILSFCFFALLLFAAVCRGEIVGFTGPAEIVDSFLAGHTPENPFYVHKVTPEATANSRKSVLLQAINEQQGVVLGSVIETNNPPSAQVAIPFGSPIGWERPGTPIPTGTLVDSHYIWLNSLPIVHNIATFKFDGPIIGLIGGPAQLAASNAPLGYNFVEYTPTTTGFVNESPFNNPTGPGLPPSGDVVARLSPAVLQVDFTSAAGDYVRVITLPNVPIHAGDFDKDYDVDFDDHAVWRSTFLSNDPSADANSNGSVEASDYIIWRENLGYAFSWPSASANQLESAIPEPSCLVLAATTAMLLVGTQRRSARRNRS
jgi:hypothetical protein